MNESIRDVLRDKLLESTDIFLDHLHIKDVLQQSGWKTHKAEEKFWKKGLSSVESVEVLVKGFSGVRIRCLIRDYALSRTLDLTIGPTTSEAVKLEDNVDKTLIRKAINVDRRKPFKASEVESTAKQVAAEVKKLRKPRAKKEYRYCKYKGQEGRAAVDAWLKDVEKVISQELKSSKDYFDDLFKQAHSTGSITNNILNNYGYNCGLNRSQAHAKIINVLKRLARKKKVKELKPRETGESKTLWLWVGS